MTLPSLPFRSTHARPSVHEAALSRLALLGTLAIIACNNGGGGEPMGTESDGIGPITTPTSTSEGPGDSTAATVAGSSSTGEPTCGESEFMLQVVPSRMVIVLDKSGSMVANTWDHDDDTMTAEITRWASLHSTVDLVTTNFNGSFEFGALLYPSTDATSTYDDFACLVNDSPEVPVGPDHAMAIMDALPPADAVEEIQGGTPSATAISVAVEHLLAAGGSMPGSILFITDGEANCRADAGVVTELFEEYDETVHTVVEDAYMVEGIPTYVVGIAIRDEVLPVGVDGTPDGINPHEQLNLLAEQGGRPQVGGSSSYYAATNQLELEAALSEIAADQFDCVVTLDPPPMYPAFVEIVINGELVERVDGCTTEDGWTFVNPDGPYDSVLLCGAACDLLAAEGTLDAIYRCPPPE